MHNVSYYEFYEGYRYYWNISKIVIHRTHKLSFELIVGVRPWKGAFPISFLELFHIFNSKADSGAELVIKKENRYQ